MHIALHGAICFVWEVKPLPHPVYFSQGSTISKASPAPYHAKYIDLSTIIKNIHHVTIFLIFS